MKQSHEYKVILYMVDEIKKVIPLLPVFIDTSPHPHQDNVDAYDKLIKTLDNVMEKGCSYLNKGTCSLMGQGGATL